MKTQFIYEYNFFISLILTVLIETLTLIGFYKFIFRKEEISINKLLFVGITASSLTLPYLWFILPIMFDTRFEYVLYGEIIVFIIEIFFYYFTLQRTLKRAFIISFVCNLTSYLLGLWII